MSAIATMQLSRSEKYSPIGLARIGYPLDSPSALLRLFIKNIKKTSEADSTVSVHLHEHGNVCDLQNLGEPMYSWECQTSNDQLSFTQELDLGLHEYIGHALSVFCGSDLVGHGVIAHAPMVDIKTAEIDIDIKVCGRVSRCQR